MNREKIKKIIRQSIDLHVHIGPEVIPRKFDLDELIKYEKGKIRGMGVKNHFFPTVAMRTNKKSEKGNPFIIFSVALNNYLGGFNLSAIRASAELSKLPIIVWFPTLHSKSFLKDQEFEVPDEWITPNVKDRIKLQKAEDVEQLSIFDANKSISQKVINSLEVIRESGAILATGHLSWEESYELVKTAIQKIGIKNIIVTHPIYQKIDMPINIQKELTSIGAFIEHCYSMHSIDKIPIKKIFQQIREVGAEKCILSSDVGQTFSLSPSEAVEEFVFLLGKEGLNEKEVRMMLIENPAKLLDRNAS
jgi:hypothetical protein